MSAAAPPPAYYMVNSEVSVGDRSLWEFISRVPKMGTPSIVVKTRSAPPQSGSVFFARDQEHLRPFTHLSITKRNHGRSLEAHLPTGHWNFKSFIFWLVTMRRAPRAYVRIQTKQVDLKHQEEKKVFPPPRSPDRATKDSIQFFSTRPLAWWSAPTNQSWPPPFCPHSPTHRWPLWWVVYKRANV